MKPKSRLTVWLAAGATMAILLGGILYASVPARIASPEVKVPPEFAGKVPEGAVRTLFGPVWFDYIAERATKFSLRATAYYQCRAVVTHVFTAAIGLVADDEFPMTLSAWRDSGALLWEYSALTDVSAGMPLDRVAQRRWLSSLPPGSLYIGRREKNIIYSGCVMSADTADLARVLQQDVGAFPRSVLEAIPAAERQRTRVKREWTSRAGQLHQGYFAYLGEKKALPEKSTDLAVVMGKEIPRAWTEDFRRYADDYFLPRANEAAKKGGFPPAEAGK